MMLIDQWEQIGRKLTALAEEFPEDRYEFGPIQDVRTFADVLRHVAFWNQYVALTARGKEADDKLNELPKAEYSSKAKIIDVLRRSIAEAAAAMKEHSAGAEPKTGEMIVAFIEHNCEHYGQLAVYARLNGMVPPASRA